SAASLDESGPRIDSGGLGMALQVEDMHHALPNGLAGSYLFKGKRIDKHDLSAVLAFNGSLELVYAYVHDLPHPIRNVSGIPVNRARGKPSERCNYRHQS